MCDLLNLLVRCTQLAQVGRGYPCAKGYNPSESQWLPWKQVRLSQDTLRCIEGPGHSGGFLKRERERGGGGVTHPTGRLTKTAQESLTHLQT